MNRYNDLEMSILSCLIQKPKLMEEVILEDKHFAKYCNVWKFLKAFYKKFGNFDFTLMYSLTTNKNQLIEYIIWLSQLEPTPSLFQKYQQQLIMLYNEAKKEKWIINKICDVTNDLLVRNVSVENFRNKIEEIYQNAEKIFDSKKPQCL